jgi:hypothetical protein
MDNHFEEQLLAPASRVWSRALVGLWNLRFFRHAPIDFWHKHSGCLTNRHASEAPPPSQLPGRKRAGIGARSCHTENLRLGEAERDSTTGVRTLGEDLRILKRRMSR